MADVKTNLREISVLIGMNNIVNNLECTFDSTVFYDEARKILPSELHNEINNLDLKSFNSEQIEILKNGYKLSEYIKKKFKINKIEKLVWYGFDTQKENPVDITINEYDFSLKEDSFILENMGLYKLVNLLTGSNHKKLHIFEDYALSEYKNWFNETWILLIDYLKNNGNRWTLTDVRKNKKSEIILNNDDIYFEYTNNGDVSASKLKVTSKLSDFKKLTNGKTREQVFSKWINKEISNNEIYLMTKKLCAKVASDNLAKHLTDNLNYEIGLPRFLRIHKNRYYYAKTTSYEQKIYLVPELKDYKNTLVIESIVGSVPNSQANIITTIKNIETGQRLVLRNECRFSHGQFNGTPEAKMYYERGNSLLTIYSEFEISKKN